MDATNGLGNYQFHEAANIFPLLVDKDFDELTDDIRKHGVRESIKVFEGKVLDGRNRYKACLLSGIKPRFEQVKVDDPIAYVLSLNLHRRQLTPSQLTMVGARARELYDQQAKDRQKLDNASKENLPESSKGQARDLAGKAVGVSGKSIDFGTKVLTKGTPELISAVDQGKMAVSTAAVLASEPSEVQNKEVSSLGNRVYKKGNGKPKPAGSDGRPVVTKEVTTAMQFASIAISQLERIRKEDPKRIDALNHVLKWIKERL